MTPLQKAAQAVIRHWDKSIDPTDAMSELRNALEAEQAQAVEPVATVQCVRGVTIGYLDVMQPVGTKLYTHLAPSPSIQESLKVRYKRGYAIGALK